MAHEQKYIDAFDQIIETVNKMIETVDEDFPLLDFNSRYMMERGMRMALIEVKRKKAVFQNDTSASN